MLNHPRPIVYCSRCLEFDHCRFDGAMIKCDMVRDLKEVCDIVHDCPEKGIGLGVPRRPVRIVEMDGIRHLVQPATGLDCTSSMERYISELLDRIGGVDGIILKAKSPTCGMGDVKIYPGPEKVPVKYMGDGFLGGEVLKRFSHLALEDEGRLQDARIRDHFLTKLYCIARFREAEKGGKARDLIDFHTRHKLLLMSQSQSEMRSMGRMVTSQKETGVEEAFREYRKHLSSAFKKGQRYTAIINTLMHGFGYVSENMSREEKGHFLDMLELYREDRIPLVAVRETLKALVIRFDVEYLKDQYFFEPYPVELLRGYEPNRGRDLWK